jgi:hypothetical protein
MSGKHLAFLPGSIKAHAGLTCQGHGRSGTTGATGFLIEDHIIALHELIYMTSTVVRHEWDEPLMRPSNSDHCARSHLAGPALQDKHPTTPCLQPVRCRNAEGKHLQPCPHMVQHTQPMNAPEAQILSSAAESLSAGCVHAVGVFSEAATTYKGAPSLGSRQRQRSLPGSSIVPVAHAEPHGTTFGRWRDERSQPTSTLKTMLPMQRRLLPAERRSQNCNRPVHNWELQHAQKRYFSAQAARINACWSMPRW